MKITNEAYERCVMCGEMTGMPISMPVEFREDYEMGFGQVCVFCRAKFREEAEKEQISQRKKCNGF